jgi:hypothetical protein
MSGEETINAWIRRLRTTAEVARRAAPRVAKVLHKKTAESIAAGKSPDGQLFEPTKAGRVPLRNAVRAITSRAIGTVVLMRVRGHHSLHHMGKARGGVRRPLLPSRLSTDMVEAIQREIVAEMREHLGGKR